MNFSLQQPDAEGAKIAQRTQSESAGCFNDCSHAVIGAAVEVQRVLGAGLLESAYSAALAMEMEARGLRFRREVSVSGNYKGVDIGILYRADFVVEDSIVIELKAVDALVAAHRAQLLTYIRLSGHKIGLLINFHVIPLVKGIQRLVNKL
ncbi:MAG TPA: GxxExxY protein [Ramlibacter sp.]|uniref:GxxExxY protein n=1 Tax=Ramlibacter sp. TaxID=1917967 RepID=UPI002C8362E7|nr:GxxExxY protein [Ramlibacter sp.]HVZ46193.1 GxxExxY protein [Ramlibacter sp.]